RARHPYLSHCHRDPHPLQSFPTRRSSDLTFAEGTVDQRIDISPNETKEVDFQLNTNIYKFLVNDSIRNDIQEYITATQQQLEKKDRKSTRLNSSHVKISYAVFCLKKKKRD